MLVVYLLFFSPPTHPARIATRHVPHWRSEPQRTWTALHTNRSRKIPHSLAKTSERFAYVLLLECGKVTTAFCSRFWPFACLLRRRRSCQVSICFGDYTILTSRNRTLWKLPKFCPTRNSKVVTRRIFGAFWKSTKDQLVMEVVSRPKKHISMPLWPLSIKCLTRTPLHPPFFN